MIDRGREYVKKRTSWHEVQAISAFLSGDREEGSCAVLTPYCRQRNLLQQALTAVPVMTVHKAQGQERDTVILSVVDTEDKWFTDSANIQAGGLNVINTAVSRAKKRLVIVCDTAYWSSQSKQMPNQLLAKLISVGKTISVESKGGMKNVSGSLYFEKYAQ